MRDDRARFEAVAARTGRRRGEPRAHPWRELERVRRPSRVSRPAWIPPPEHEELKKIIARLVEAYADEADVDLNGFGETTYREEAVERGLEADECYMLGRRKRVPDLAIEVVVSSPLLDELDVYRGLGVPEVWVYRSGKLTVHVLGPRGYETKTRSKALPDLDLALFVSFVRRGQSQNKLVRELRAAIGAAEKPRRRRRPAKK